MVNQDLKINNTRSRNFKNDEENENSNNNGFLPCIYEKPTLQNNQNIKKQPLNQNNNYNNLNTKENQDDIKSAQQSDNEDFVDANERFKRLTRMRIKLKRDKEAAEKVKEADKTVKDSKKNFKYRYYIENGNGFCNLFKPMANRVDWKEQSEQDPILCNQIHIQKVKSDFFKNNMPAHKDVNLEY